MAGKAVVVLQYCHHLFLLTSIRGDAVVCTMSVDSIGELIEAGLRPSLVIGVPVGFVNVVDSKEQIFAVCEKHRVPAIVARGRKGGSTVAAAICNALLYAAADMITPTNRGWQG